MDVLFELAALSPDDGLALEGSMEPSERSLSDLMLLPMLFYVMGLLGYFAFPLVCLRLVREFIRQRPGWKNAAAAVAVGIILALACQTVVGLLLYFQSVHSEPPYLAGNTLPVSWSGQIAANYLGPLLLFVLVFPVLRKLLRKEGLATLASGFGRAYLLLFFVPFAVFMLFQTYANSLANPEIPLRPAPPYLVFGLAAVPVFYWLLRSLVRQVKTVPGLRRTAAITAYIVMPLFPIPAGVCTHLYMYYANDALWPNTTLQTAAFYSLVLFFDPLWTPLLIALIAAGALRLCTGRVISGTQAMLAKKIVFLCAASIYIMTACRFLFW